MKKTILLLATTAVGRVRFGSGHISGPSNMDEIYEAVHVSGQRDTVSLLRQGLRARPELGSSQPYYPCDCPTWSPGLDRAIRRQENRNQAWRPLGLHRDRGKQMGRMIIAGMAALSREMCSSRPPSVLPDEIVSMKHNGFWVPVSRSPPYKVTLRCCVGHSL